MYESIPGELKALPQWVCWQSVPDENRPGKIKKLPVNAMTGEPAQSNNPNTWTSYDVAAAAGNRFSGIGFMFANGYFGVDIDGIEGEIQAYRDDPQSDNIVWEFIYSLRSYAEYSVSGRGLHIICRGKLPPNGRRRGNVEMYENGRFFIMTGNSASEYTEINDCTTAIKSLHEKYISGGCEPTTGIIPARATTSLSQSEIYEAIDKSKQAAAFKGLNGGNWEAYYTSRSEADLAFCNMLAFWTGRNKPVMDSMFRASGLMRPKWDEKHGKGTYGDITLNKAISGCDSVYEPKPDYSVKIGGAKPSKLYSFDDTGNAQRMFDTFGEKIRYSYVNKSWMYYDERKWCDDYLGIIKKLADEVVESMKGDAPPADLDPEEFEKAFAKHMKNSRSSKGKTAMIKETEHRVPILPAQMDAHNHVINTPAGIINLRNGEIEPHDPKRYITKIAYADYTPHTDAPLWKQFLRDIFNGDEELIRYVQKAVGYSMTGSTQEQCIFFCYGTGRNGKSTFINIIGDMLGDYAVNMQPESIMVKNSSGGANSDIARLMGARFVTTVEPSEGVRLNEGLVKQLTGGDPITARKLYGNEFEFKPEFKLWMATNHKPVVRGTDEGIWRRIHLIPFEVYIPKEKIDRRLSYKLKQELPGIMAWAVDGCLMWQREGLEMPSAVRQATAEYRNEMDVISAFLGECCCDGQGSIRAADLFQTYAKWADENNEYKMSNTKFGKEVSKKYRKIHDNGGTVYIGITLKSEHKPYKIGIGKTSY